MPDGSSLSRSSPPPAASKASQPLSASSTTATTASRPLPRTVLSRSQLAQRIAKGEALVLHDRLIYKLDSWLSRHPGGELAILHFVGRDASCEIEAYHSDATLRRMRGFAVALLDEKDFDGEDGKGYKPLTPPVQLGYRNGKLDHPDAQWSTWHRFAEQRREEREEHRRNEGKEAREARERRKVAKLLGAAVAGEVSTPAHLDEEADDDDDDWRARRPTSLPIPVEMLEPPAPPSEIDAAREQRISKAWKQMHRDVKKAGLYELRPWGYARETARYIFLGGLALYFYRLASTNVAEGEGGTALFLVSSLFLGLFWHQLTFTAHDAGHSGITHSHVVDRLIGTLIADLIGGLSIGWWCDNHDVHHLVTNHPEHDPDIQHMPFFAISPSFLVDESPSGLAASSDADEANKGHGAADAGAHGLWSSYYRRVLLFDSASRFFLRHQHKLYYLVMSLGRFNLYANSYSFLLLKARRRHLFFAMELLGLAGFWYWFGWRTLGGIPDWGTRIAFLLISHIVTSPLHVQIVLSHFAQSSADLGLYESFASRQVRTTMDVSCPPWLDFLHGGLHMQVSHHLFPRVPRHNLREVRDGFVRPFCQRQGLRYEEYGFTEGNGRVLGTLREVGRQVGLLGRVAEAKAKGELH